MPDSDPPTDPDEPDCIFGLFVEEDDEPKPKLKPKVPDPDSPSDPDEPEMLG